MPWRRHIARLRRIRPGRGYDDGHSERAGEQFVADIFHEVDEEVRRERLKKLWERYSIFIIALAVLIVAGIGGWRGYEWYDRQEGGGRRRRVRGGGDAEPSRASTPRREAAFAKVGTEAPAGYSVLARLRAAAELGGDASPRTPSRPMTHIAADASLGRTVQDLAAVRAGMLLVDSAPFAEMQQKLSSRWPSPGGRSATARANCWRCRPGAATTSRHARKYIDMITRRRRNAAGNMRTRADISRR